MLFWAFSEKVSVIAGFLDNTLGANFFMESAEKLGFADFALPTMA